MANIRPFCMPKWGIEMTEGTVAEWMVKEGEAFKRGQTLCLIETDKITNEVEAEFDAVVRRMIVPAGGDPQAVGVLLAVFADAEVSDADIESFVQQFKAADTSVAAKKGAEANGPVAGSEPAAIATNRPISPEALKLATEHALDLARIDGSGRGGRITYQDVHQAIRPSAAPKLGGAADLTPQLDGFYASPLAKRLAVIHGVNLGAIKGTGPRGRISKADVLAQVPRKTDASVQRAPVDNTPEIVPMDKIRKVVARRLTEAKATIPHYYLRMNVRIDALLELRKTANLVMGSKATINDYLIRAVALALVRHPNINIQVHGDAVHHFRHADISVAVASPKGLVTPIVRAADTLRVDEIALVTRGLIEKAQAGKLSYDDMDGGSFSISNLGMFGIDQFDAIINPPQGAILAVGGINRSLGETADGDVIVEGRMACTLSCDHRAIDGAAGAQFMASLRALIETPEALFGSV